MLTLNTIPRVYYAEWSKLEKEKQIPYINAYIWNLEKWYWGTCLQGRNRDSEIDREQTYGHSKGSRGGDELKEKHWNTYIIVYKLDS